MFQRFCAGQVSDGESAQHSAGLDAVHTSGRFSSEISHSYFATKKKSSLPGSEP